MSSAREVGHSRLLKESVGGSYIVQDFGTDSKSRILRRILPLTPNGDVLLQVWDCSAGPTMEIVAPRNRDVIVANVMLHKDFQRQILAHYFASGTSLNNLMIIGDRKCREGYISLSFDSYSHLRPNGYSAMGELLADFRYERVDFGSSGVCHCMMIGECTVFLPASLKVDGTTPVKALRNRGSEEWMQLTKSLTGFTSYSV